MAQIHVKAFYKKSHPFLVLLFLYGRGNHMNKAVNSTMPRYHAIKLQPTVRGIPSPFFLPSDLGTNEELTSTMNRIVRTIPKHKSGDGSEKITAKK